MKHLKISVSKKPKEDAVLSTQKVSIGKRAMKKLFGGKSRVAIILPGEAVDEITVTDLTKGVNAHDRK